MECEENDGEEEGESDGIYLVGIFLDSFGNILNSLLFLVFGEFDLNIDVYGIKCYENLFRKEVYFMVIIDIFIYYDVKKKVVYVVKIVKYGVGVEIFIVNLE